MISVHDADASYGHKPRLVGSLAQRPRNAVPAHFHACGLSSAPEGPGDRPAARHDHAAYHRLPARLYGSFAVNPKTIVKTERTAAAAELPDPPIGELDQRCLPVGGGHRQTGRASGRERVCQYG